MLCEHSSRCAVDGVSSVVVIGGGKLLNRNNGHGDLFKNSPSSGSGFYDPSSFPARQNVCGQGFDFFHSRVKSGMEGKVSRSENKRCPSYVV